MAALTDHAYRGYQNGFIITVEGYMIHLRDLANECRQGWGGQDAVLAHDDLCIPSASHNAMNRTWVYRAGGIEKGTLLYSEVALETPLAHAIFIITCHHGDDTTAITSYNRHLTLEPVAVYAS